ncbi:MAG: RHS repeat-associated core domain-containing protein [Candidatus Omnitrophota bacterium]
MLTPATLVATPTSTSELAEFLYDADGFRVKKTYNGVSIIYVGDLYEKTGSLTTKHIYLGANRIASRTSTDTLYYHSDHLGSSNIITNASGAQVQLSEYRPFGELSLNTATRVNYYFTGKELDPTGLYYYGARYYDPKVGRFITADNYVAKPFNPQYLNRYSYCMNNPLRYIDPTGNSATDNLTNSLFDFNQDLWKTFSSFAFNSINTISSASLQFGQMALYESRIWASALRIGTYYAIDEARQTINSYQENNVLLGFKFINYFPPVLHTNIVVKTSKFGSQVVGFNPSNFSFDILLGKSVEGKIYFNEDYQFYLPYSVNKRYAEILYQLLLSKEKSTAPMYNLYGLNGYNCYEWRDEPLLEAYRILNEHRE